jgi:hypothetical protein
MHKHIEVPGMNFEADVDGDGYGGWRSLCGEGLMSTGIYQCIYVQKQNNVKMYMLV